MAVVVLSSTAFDIDSSRRNLSVRPLEFFEIERMGLTSSINIYHASGLSLDEELICAHRKFRAVGKVISDRILAANVVTDLDRTGRDLHAVLLEFPVEDVVEKDGLGNLAKFGMAMLVISKADSGILDFFGIQIMAYAFSYYDSALRDTEELAFDDCRKGKADKLIESNRRLVEHLGNNGHRAVSGLADTKGEMAG